MTGTVKKKTDRGFGFISVEGQDQDLFFHSTALVGVSFDELSEGATVTFDVKDGNDGRKSAQNVKLAGQESVAEEAPAEVAEEAEAEQSEPEVKEEVVEEDK